MNTPWSSPRSVFRPHVMPLDSGRMVSDVVKPYALRTTYPEGSGRWQLATGQWDSCTCTCSILRGTHSTTQAGAHSVWDTCRGRLVILTSNSRGLGDRTSTSMARLPSQCADTTSIALGRRSPPYNSGKQDFIF